MPDDAVLSFAGLLRHLRMEARLTQEELAEAASVAPRSISDLERGVSRTARKVTALLLADALKLTGPERELFVAAARGRADVADVLAAKDVAVAPGARLGNLPAQLTTFIGRDRELADVRELLEASRLVTLTGAGGAGKTRLGLQVAAQLLDGTSDGVWLVELDAVTDQDALPATIAATLRIPPQPGRPMLDVLGDALAPLDMLIALDNCEHLIGGCAMTAEAILRRCPKVRVIATSREPLGIAGEVIYRVPSLSLPDTGDPDPAAVAASDAVALLAARAEAQGIAFALTADTIPLVVSVCARLDGMPLAIELAAARLRSMSLADLADRLDQRFKLLTGGSRTALKRQQTLSAAIGWSYSLLNPAEQLLLGRLSVFAAGFDLSAAEAVGTDADIESLEVADLLGSLADKSLVVTESAGTGMRYRLLETIRLFAAERLGEHGDGQQAAAARAAHCAHYLAVAEAAGPHLVGREQGSWFDRLQADHANLRRAGEHAATRPGGTAQVLRFGIALMRFWLCHHHYQEAAGLLVPTLRRPEASADPALFSEALFAASLLTVVTDGPTCLQLAQEADQVARKLGDTRLLTMSSGMLCLAYYLVGELEQARSLGRESAERARQLGDDVLLGMNLRAYALAAEPATAEPLLAEAIACTDRSGDLFINIQLHHLAGLADLQKGNLSRARAHLEAATQATNAMRLPSLQPSYNLGLALRAEHELDGARAAFEYVIRNGRRTASMYYVASAMLGLAGLAGDLADWSRAATLYGAAQTLRDQTRHQWQPSEARGRRESVDHIAAALGEELFQQAYAQGMALSYDQAIDLALSGTAA